MTKQGFKAIFIFVFSVTFSVFASGQTPNIQIQLDRGDSLRRDFSMFRTTLQNNSPSLYRYVDKLKLNALFDSCYATINTNTTEFNLLNKIKFLMSSIKDGHLYCSPSPKLKQYLNREAMFFPLKLQFIEKKAFMFSPSSYGLPIGTEIISVNDKSINFIRKELFKYIVSDGSIETKKYHILNNSFYFYYLMVYGEQSIFKITYKSKTGELKKIKINASLEKGMPQNNKNEETGNPLSLSFSDNVASLTIITFDSLELKKANLDFPGFLENSFRKINKEKVKKLIIDLRGNGGGRDLYGSLLYSFIANKEFNYYKNLITITKNLPYDQFKSSVSSFNNLKTNMLEDINKKYFRLKNEAHNNLQTMQPNVNNFNGKVWFLIDGLSFSTTAELCAIAKSNMRGQFIGEETGGAYYGNTSGINIDKILPYTKIGFSFGIVKYEMLVNKTKFNDRGVIPDYKIMPTVMDIINKRDIQLEFVLKLAKDE